MRLILDKKFCELFEELNSDKFRKKEIKCDKS